VSDRFSAFRHSSYSRYFISRFCTSLGAQIVSVAVSWQIYSVTQNKALLGWIGLVQFLPALVLVMVTGVAADRLGRRNVMGVSVFVEMACAVVILGLALSGQFNAFWVLASLTVFGIARAFYSPASSSLAVNLVPREDFANAVGWLSSSWQLASILGPVLGGFLYDASPEAAYATAAALFLAAGLLIFTVPKPQRRIAKEPTTLSSLIGGFAYVWKEKVVLGAISLDLFAVLLGGAVALLPVYAQDILHLGPGQFGFLRAAPGIGAVIMIAIITAFPIKDHAGIILFVCVALFGLATVVFGASTLAWVSILALALIGAFDMVSVYIREILLQLWTPDEVRGRVSAVNSVFLGASNELGEARAGFMAHFYGAVFTVVAGGAAAIGVAAAWSFLFPAIRKTRYLHRDEVQ